MTNNITYCSWFSFPWILFLWKRLMCTKGIHLLDECSSDKHHYLVCDACQIEIHIYNIKE